ncbi:hypothetical protein ACFY2R_18075 [Micromonospora olivasterospora]|uniref:Uncharacterized protein n=1 Tax=Micromonospora olivasterospora TaxID=1880 RepID=A0A562HUJ9_MICOL|nr:hypothetical protein [Micromonospora olivasterospora]TWH62302.1 hypothetical protein JD77_06353 [Micromonospora olivasterospora]
MRDVTCLPHLDVPVRQNRWLVQVFLVVGVYGLVLTMLAWGFPVEVCVLASAAVTATAVQATRSAAAPARSLLSYLAALPPRA